jgi:aryl-alcohol dehydrogenase-like predicted oxidoreductase
VPPGAAAVSSKWGYAYVGGWRLDAQTHEVKEHTRRRFLDQRDETDALLGPWLGLYQIHSLTPESGALDDARLLRALAALKEKGVAVGFSTSGPRQGETIDRAIAATVDGRPLFDAAQATWSLLEPSAGPALARAARAGLGVIVKEPLANGRLTDRALAAAPERWARPLRRAAAEAGATVDALAIAAALANDWCDAALSGAVTVAQLRANLGALAVGPEAVAAAREITPPEPPEAYWAARARLPWA